MERKATWGIIVVLVIAALMLYNSFAGASVSAQGYSSLKVNPDKTSIYLSVETKDASAEGAKDKNVEIRERLLRNLDSLGLDDEVQLLNYNIYPEYDWSDGNQQKIIGYTARYDIIVETSDFELVSEIVDTAVSSGAGISYISFDLSEEKRSEYKAQALEAASQDARTKAEATAKGLGKSLGRLVSVDSEEFNYMPFRAYDSSVASEGSVESFAKDINPQELEVTANVNVKYKLSSF